MVAPLVLAGAALAGGAGVGAAQPTEQITPIVAPPGGDIYLPPWCVPVEPPVGKPPVVVPPITQPGGPGEGIQPCPPTIIRPVLSVVSS